MLQNVNICVFLRVVFVYSSTFGSEPAVSPRGRWSLVAGTDILTHISTGTRL